MRRKECRSSNSLGNRGEEVDAVISYSDRFMSAYWYDKIDQITLISKWELTPAWFLAKKLLVWPFFENRLLISIFKANMKVE